MRNTEKIVKNESAIEPICLETSLDDLIKESKSIFSILDRVSVKIRELEKSLSELKAHFPFTYELPIGTEVSEEKLFEEHHKERFSCDGTYQVLTVWSLSWQKDEKTTSFRLFLLAAEKERWLFSNSSYAGDGGEDPLPKCRIVRPLIETDMATRLKFSRYLNDFIMKFCEYLKNYRLCLETGAPF